MIRSLRLSMISLEDRLLFSAPMSPFVLARLPDAKRIRPAKAALPNEACC